MGGTLVLSRGWWEGSSHHSTQWVLWFSLVSCDSHSHLGGVGLLVEGKPKCRGQGLERVAFGVRPVHQGCVPAPRAIALPVGR